MYSPRLLIFSCFLEEMALLMFSTETRERLNSNDVLVGHSTSHIPTHTQHTNTGRPAVEPYIILYFSGLGFDTILTSPKLSLFATF